MSPAASLWSPSWCLGPEPRCALLSELGLLHLDKCAAGAMSISEVSAVAEEAPSCHLQVSVLTHKASTNEDALRSPSAIYHCFQYECKFWEISSGKHAQNCLKLLSVAAALQPELAFLVPEELEEPPA